MNSEEPKRVKKSRFQSIRPDIQKTDDRDKSSDSKEILSQSVGKSTENNTPLVRRAYSDEFEVSRQTVGPENKEVVRDEEEFKLRFDESIVDEVIEKDLQFEETKSKSPDKGNVVRCKYENINISIEYIEK